MAANDGLDIQLCDMTKYRAIGPRAVRSEREVQCLVDQAVVRCSFILTDLQVTLLLSYIFQVYAQSSAASSAAECLVFSALDDEAFHILQQRTDNLLEFAPFLLEALDARNQLGRC